MPVLLDVEVVGYARIWRDIDRPQSNLESNQLAQERGDLMQRGVAVPDAKVE
jgi:hypothetical protein